MPPADVPPIFTCSPFLSGGNLGFSEDPASKRGVLTTQQPALRGLVPGLQDRPALRHSSERQRPRHGIRLFGFAGPNDALVS